MFTLSIVTPEKKLVENLEIKELTVPAFMGELNILPGHAPLMTLLSTGIIRYIPVESSSVFHVVISSGYLEIFSHGINVLAETAEKPDEIDFERAKQAEKLALQKLGTINLAGDELDKFSRKLERARVRQETKKMDK